MRNRARAAAAAPLLAAGLLLLALGGCADPAARTQRALQKAEALVGEGEWERAAIEVRNALQLDPHNAHGFQLGGQIAEARGDLPAAFAADLRAAELAPGNVDIACALARVQVIGGDRAQAQTAVQQLQARWPRDARVLTVQAVWLAREGRMDEALARAAQAAPDAATARPDAVLVRAGLLSQTGAPDAALAQIERALQAHPSDLNLHAAAAQMASGLAATPLADAAPAPGGAAASGASMAERATGLLRRATARWPHQAGLWTAWSDLLLKRGDLDGAERVLKDGVAANDGQDALVLPWLRFVQRHRDAATAEAAWREAVRRQPQNSARTLGLVAHLDALHREDEATAALQALAGRRADSPAALLARVRLAERALARGDALEAERWSSEVLQRNPRDGDGLMVRARVSLALGRPGAAVSDLRAALRDRPGQAEIAGLLAQAHHAAGEPELARDALKDAVALRPESVDLHLLLAAELREHGAGPADARAALQQLDEAIRAAPRDPRAYHLKARLAQAAGDRAGAASAVAALARARPGDGQTLQLQGDLALAQGRLDIAADAYERWWRALPADADACRALAQVRLQRGDLAGAEAVFAAGLRADPDSLAVPAARAAWLVAAGRLDDARRAYEALLSQGPVPPVVSNDYAWLLIDLLGDPASLARADALTSGFATSRDPALLDTRGWLLWRRGRAAQALPLLQQAVALAPRQAPLQLHLGLALVDAGQLQEGRRQLAQALARGGPGLPHADEARRRLRTDR